MKRIISNARQQVRFALTIAAIGLQAVLPTIAEADGLDDAIAMAEARPVSPLLPREIILNQLAIREVTLSPDGQKLAYIQVDGSKRFLWLLSLDTGEQRRLFASKLMNDLSWASDSEHLYLESSQGIAVVPLSQAASPEFVINVERNEEEYGYGVDSQHTNGFFVTLRSDDRASHTLYRVLPDGSKEALYSHAARTVDFALNDQGEIAVVRRINDEVFDVVRVEEDDEQLLFTCSKHDHCSFQSYDEASDSLYIRGHLGGDLIGLYQVNLLTGQKKLVHQDPQGRFDMRHVAVDVKTHKPVLVSYIDDYLSYYGLSDAAQKAIDRIEQHFDSDMLNMTASADLKRWLVRDINPGRAIPHYYIYDAETDSFGRPLEAALNSFAEAGRHQPEDTVAIRLPIHYTVSDGMPGRKGIELAEDIREAFPSIQLIFATAFAEHAANAYRLPATDYLVKPIGGHLLAEACERVERQLSLESSHSAKDAEDLIVIKSVGRTDYVKIQDIIMGQAAGNYVRLVCAEKEYLHRCSFAELIDQLTSRGFLRCHRSFFVNASHVVSFVRSVQDGDELLLDCGLKAPVSQSHKKSLEEALTGL